MSTTYKVDDTVAILDAYKGVSRGTVTGVSAGGRVTVRVERGFPADGTYKDQFSPDGYQFPKQFRGARIDPWTRAHADIHAIRLREQQKRVRRIARDAAEAELERQRDAASRELILALLETSTDPRRDDAIRLIRNQS